MSSDLLPPLEQLQTTLESAKDQQQLTGAARATALEQELEQLDIINASIDGVIGSIESTSVNLDAILNTSESTNTVLDLWIKILSQTSYTSNLLSDKSWNGLTKSEEEYQQQLKRFEELNRRYALEKQSKEQSREEVRQRKLAQEQKLREREESLKRRVYGTKAAPKIPRVAKK